MPAHDICEQPIIRALQKAGWRVIDTTGYVYDDEADMFVFIDLKVEHPANGQSEAQLQTYVEVKCFPGHNKSQEIYIALGQYLIYAALLARQHDLTPLFLAVPFTIYENHFRVCLQSPKTGV